MNNKILVIEDNKPDFFLVKTYLSNYTSSNNISHSSTLADGIKSLLTDPPDVILLDMNLPDSCGLETIRKMSEHNSEIPVVVLTGNNDIEFGKTVLSLGASDYLSKDSITEESLWKSVIYSIERKKNDKILRENSEFYRVLFKNNQTITLLIDPENGDIVDANNTACRFYGYTPEEIKCKKIYDINAARGEEISRSMEMALNKQLIRSQFLHRLSNNEIREVEASSEPLFINGRKLLHSVIVDVTERNRIREELSYRNNKRLLANQLLSKFIKLVVTSRKLPELIKEISENSSREFEIDSVRICFADDKICSSKCEAAGDISHSCILEEIGQTGLEHLSKGNSIVIDDFNEVNGVFGIFKGQYLSKDSNSMMIVPMMAEREYIGAIICASKKLRKWWTEEEAFFSSVADIIAIAKDAESHATEEEKLNLEIRKSNKEIVELNKLQYELLEVQNALLDGIPDMAWMKDCEGKFKAVNKVFASKCNFPKEEIINKTDYDVWDHKSAEAFRENDLKVIKSGEEQKNEEWIADKDGEKKLYETIKVPIFSRKGQVVGTVGIARDITLLKKASEVLETENRKLEELVAGRTEDLQKVADSLRQEMRERTIVEDQLKKLSVAVEQSPVSILITDTKGIIEYVNPKFCETTGYLVEETIGRNPKFLQSGSTPGEVYNQLWGKLSEGSVWVGELLNKKKNNELYWEQCIISPIKNTSGIVTNYIGIKKDITEEKNAERKLKESEERFRTIFENSPVGIRISVNGVTQFVNQSFVEMYGYNDSSELIGSSILVGIAESDRTTAMNYLVKRAKGEKTPDQFTFRGVKKDGTGFPINVSIAQLMLPEGRALVGFYTDITDQKLKENQIISSLKEKEVLLKEIHHRVKNNLQIISSLLNLQTDSITDPVLMEAFNVSRNRVKAMALIHERLYHSKNLSVIDLNEYISEMVVYLQRTYINDGKRVDFKLNLEPISLSIDTAIPCGLIVNELVSNALKYAFVKMDSGILTISLQHNEDKTISLEVADNGIGFPPGFDISSTSTLGLQLVYNLVEQIGGSIEIRNENGVRFITKFRL